jgi:predicted metal-dependent RNase
MYGAAAARSAASSSLPISSRLVSMTEAATSAFHRCKRKAIRMIERRLAQHHGARAQWVRASALGGLLGAPMADLGLNLMVQRL